jgi:hypothetical protein
MVRNVVVITWKTPEYLVPRKEFFGIPGQSFLKPYNSEEWDPTPSRTLEFICDLKGLRFQDFMK